MSEQERENQGAGATGQQREEQGAGATAPEQPQRRVGVYICHCGGNISDYVDVQAVVDEAAAQPGVVVAKRAMFTCSDATQQEIIDDIREQNLDGLVVASCSPKLHTMTFRGAASRAGLNPYEYTQVNIREQCSWAHTDDREGATEKAKGLVRAGIARTKLTIPLEPIEVRTVPKALVIGGGIAGLRAAIGLSDVGIAAFVVEKQAELGGWVATFGRMYRHDRDGADLISELVTEVRRRPDITVFTGAEVVSKSGSFGNYRVGVRAGGDTIELEVGSIVVATGFDTYQPEVGEYGYGIDGVVTLPEFKAMVDKADGPLTYRGRPVRDVAYIYCVGSRQDPDVVEGGNAYCSKYCCAATAHTSIQVADLGPGVHQYHLYRDLRAYGPYELMFNESRDKGSVYIKVDDDAPPEVTRDDAGGRVVVTTKDLLAAGEELRIKADLVVLVTGMVPRKNDDLIKALKLPIGRDGFFNEIHPKLRPVETVVDGVFICGACQAPKNSAESVSSGLAAVTQAAGILKKEIAQLDPMIAAVNTEACTWCGACENACPYAAISKVSQDGREVAVIDGASCKGCGGCVPLCPEDAIDLRGYADAQLKDMINGLVGAR